MAVEFIDASQHTTALVQSQKTQGFCVADVATLSGERRPRSKNFPLFIWIKEPCVRKFEGLERSKLLGISQTKFTLKDKSQDRQQLDNNEQNSRRFLGMTKMPLLPIRKLPEVSSIRQVS